MYDAEQEQKFSAGMSILYGPLHVERSSLANITQTFFEKVTLDFF